MIRVGITMGDPAGIGPEVLVRALDDAGLRSVVEPTVFAAESVITSLSRRFGWPMSFELRDPTGPVPADFETGRFSEAGARAALACLEAATDALARGELQALVTGPIHKRVLATCETPGPGHTEWLMARLGAERAVMMLAGPRLKVVLATTHVPLREVADRLSETDLVSTIELAARELERYFHPGGVRLALAALNPHGEERGEPGREERDVLAPAIATLRDRGVRIEGPLPGDTVFARVVAGEFDAAVALYHDQGLAPIKTLHFDETVNVTLGLGTVRTSPGHGVAYELAGQGVASSDSMRAAIHMAADMAGKDAGP